MPLFTGRVRDAETSSDASTLPGLDYFGARFYGSTMGRFLSPDEPLADQRSTDSQSWNLYSYARNNPLSNRDPTGHQTQICQIGGAGYQYRCRNIRNDEFRDYVRETKDVLTFASNGGIYLKDGTLIGTWQVKGPDIPRDAQEIFTRVARGAGPLVEEMDWVIVIAGCMAITEFPMETQPELEGQGLGVAGGRYARDVNVNPRPPVANEGEGYIGTSPAQIKQLNQDIAAARAAGATDIRVSQQQVNSDFQRVGVNQPDLQYTLNGQRYYIEHERSAAWGRGVQHDLRIRANDPSDIVIIKIIR